ncbi:hypothetical protein GCM10010103_09820 [Streptomyces paradoxus]|uniref:Uncharacterized protein n=1 Tax=Streptomyces paradoxus TaxID=66375 RepID=A0A7W9T4V0_9ACTN|nr:hypothetical protein [Streptomyces paradoxus]
MSRHLFVRQQLSRPAWQRQVADKAALEDPGATPLLVDVQGGPLVPAEYAASQPAPQFAGGALWRVRVQQPGHVVGVASERADPGWVKVVVGRGEELGRVADTVRVVAHCPEGAELQRDRLGEGHRGSGHEGLLEEGRAQ